MAGISIQFYGMDQVLRACENRKCPAWGIFGPNRQFLFKYDGNEMKESIDMLQQTLECMTVSSAAYTIKFYEQEGSKQLKIKENTPCDGSFNFKLFDEEEREERKVNLIGTNRTLLERLDKQEQLINELLERFDGEPEEEGPKTFADTIGALVSDPNKLMEFFNTLNAGKALLMGTPATPLHHMGNVSRVGQTQPGPAAAGSSQGANLSPEQKQEEDLKRLGAALDVLGTADALIIPHLEKLAAIASSNPTQFKFILSLLDNM